MEKSDILPIDLKAEYELRYSAEDLDAIQMMLSEREKQELDELSAMNKQKGNEGDFLEGLLKVTKDGVLQYIDAITDINDSLDYSKNPGDINQFDKVEIEKKNKPKNPSGSSNWEKRTIYEAKTDPFDKNCSKPTDGMSEQGSKAFNRYREAYKQRTKTVTGVSKGGNKLNSGDSSVNNASLAGLASYRFGPVVAPTPAGEMKSLYEADLKSSNSCIDSKEWIRSHNYGMLEQELMNTFGFKTKTEAREFYRSNNLTPHEGPDGIYLIPTDMHDAVSHSGYASKMKEVLEGKKTPQEVEKEFKEQKLSQYRHEGYVRGQRVVNGVLLSMAKDTAKLFVGVLIRECIVIIPNKEGTLTDRIKLIMRNVWDKIKIKLKNFWNEFKTGIAGSVVSEIFTALNDFIFRTAKNIFKIIRMTWKSLYSAVKVIFSSKSSWSERIFEASKILASALVGVLGFSVQEMIEKSLLGLGLPPNISGIFSEIFSGLFSGILSAIMLYLFDEARKRLTRESIENKKFQKEVTLTRVEMAELQLAVSRTELAMEDTLCVFDNCLTKINTHRMGILNSIELMKDRRPNFQADTINNFNEIDRLLEL